VPYTIAVPDDLRAAIIGAAQREGLSPGIWATRVLAAAAGYDFAQGQLRNPLPARLFAVRLAGHVPGLNEADAWWDRAARWWRISESSTAPYLGAADPMGAIRHAWRVQGWEQHDENLRWGALGGTHLDEGSDGIDGEMYRAVVGKYLPRQRAPIYTRFGPWTDNDE
jgi:hypothetical protein